MVGGIVSGSTALPKHRPVILRKELESCQVLELSKFGSSHLENADSGEGIAIRNHTFNELTSWLTGSWADSSLIPSSLIILCTTKVRQSQENTIKEEENDAVDILNEAVSLTILI